MKAGSSSRVGTVPIQRADELFEQRTIVDIQAIEKLTLKEIENRRSSLRQLVGESYKDVIVSADSILAISNHAKAIQTDLHRIQNTLKRPIDIPRKANVRNAAEDSLLVTGSRMKYILDTLEVVWSALDVGDFSEATKRLMRSEVVHSSLMRNAKESVSKQFPFFERQWPSIPQLRPQILDSMKQFVIEKREMEERETLPLLTAMAMLTCWSSEDLLRNFLQCRRLSVLNLSTNVLTPTTTPSEVLSQIGRLMQNTVTHVSSLFLKETTGNEAALLHKSILDDAFGFSGLLFGKLEEVSEQEIWREELVSRKQRLELIDTDSVVSTVLEWLEDVALVVKESAEGLLLNCTDLKSLAEIERIVRSTVADTEWETRMHERLDVDLDLWQTVFEAVIQEKCLSIVAASFTTTSSRLKEKLSTLKASVSSKEMERLSRMLLSSWELHAKRLGGESVESFRSEAIKIVDEFDAELASIMREVSSILDVRGSHAVDEDHSPTASVRHGGSVRSFSLLSGTHHRGMYPRRTERGIALEPKIQSLWENAALDLAADLEQQIVDLPQVETKTLPSVENALLIGTVAMGLTENCPCMGILAGPVEEWRHDNAHRSTRSSVKGETPQSTHLSNAFSNAAFAGIQFWAEWAVEALVSLWREQIHPDHLRGDENMLEISIAHHGDESSEDQQMRFSIPAATSEPTTMLLMNAALETQRLGFYSTQSQILHLFQFKLVDAVYKHLEQMLDMLQQTSLSDNYVLQILLDFRFICDICSAGEPVPRQDLTHSDLQRSLSVVPEDAASLHDTSQRKDPAVKRAVQECHRKARELESRFSNLLDPIDWATYEPHLWTAEQRSYRRTQILFGSVSLTSKSLHTDVAVKLPTASVTNSLHAAPVADRFQYLPVRPMTKADKGQRSAIAANYAALVEEADDPAGLYLFSETAHPATSHSSTKPETDVVSLTSLGTIFTDKAVEMSALAQQRIEQVGDYLQPSSLTSNSIFSSFAKRLK